MASCYSSFWALGLNSFSSTFSKSLFFMMQVYHGEGRNSWGHRSRPCRGWLQRSNAYREAPSQPNEQQATIIPVSFHPSLPFHQSSSKLYTLMMKNGWRIWASVDYEIRNWLYLNKAACLQIEHSASVFNISRHGFQQRAGRLIDSNDIVTFPRWYL